MDNIAKEKEENSKKLKKPLIAIITIVIIAIVTTIVIYKVTYTQEYANKKMTKIVAKYYEENFKENSAQIGRLIVTLQTLEDAGYSIKGITGKPGVSKDLNQAFSYVIIENPEETDKDKIIYTIENHLNGE